MSEHFSLWQERCLQIKEAQAQAQAILNAFVKQERDFAELCATKQSAPYHCEGDTVRDHLNRALIFLFALQQPECAVQGVDEWNAAKHIKGFFIRLQETLIKEKSFLTAYILAHDIGKKDTAVQDDKGWHYYGHARKGAEASYSAFREACLVFAGCSPSDAKLLRELVRIHMEIIGNISQKKETPILGVAQGIAQRQGINVERFLSLLPATFLLDAILGSYEAHASVFKKASDVIRFAEQEYSIFPQKKEEDMLALHRKEKETKKRLLAEHGLGPEEWFVRLNTAYGKERGRVVQILEHFIAGVEDSEDVRYVGEEHAQELRIRSAALREGKK